MYQPVLSIYLDQTSNTVYAATRALRAFVDTYARLAIFDEKCTSAERIQDKSISTEGTRRVAHPHERPSSILPFAFNAGFRAFHPGIFSLKHERSIFRSVIQPCMWFLHDGTGWTLYCLASRELDWHFQHHIQGWVNDLNMLLSCFREKMPAQAAVFLHVERDLE